MCDLRYCPCWWLGNPSTTPHTPTSVSSSAHGAPTRRTNVTHTKVFDVPFLAPQCDCYYLTTRRRGSSSPLSLCCRPPTLAQTPAPPPHPRPCTHFSPAHTMHRMGKPPWNPMNRRRRGFLCVHAKGTNKQGIMMRLTEEKYSLFLIKHTFFIFPPNI